MEKKIDQRIILTHNMLKKALINLLDKKAIKSISVKELCDTADINRSTFYAHYECIYDLLEEIEEDMFEELKITFAEYESSKSPDKDVSNLLFTFFAKNSAMCKILLGTNSDIRFLHKLLELGEKKFYEYFKRINPQIDKSKLEFFYQYASSGFVGILSVWLQNNMDMSIEDISTNLRQIFDKGIQYLN